MLFGCVACSDDRRLLTYFDITNQVRQETSEAVSRLSAELRFNSETMESQAAYLASLAETAEENAQRADAARMLLEHEIAERHQRAAPDGDNRRADRRVKPCGASGFGATRFTAVTVR